MIIMNLRESFIKMVEELREDLMKKSIAEVAKERGYRIEDLLNFIYILKEAGLIKDIRFI